MSQWRGWLISVESKRSRGGQPVSRMYADRIADPEAAMLAVKQYAVVTDENMRIVAEATLSQLEGLGAADGKVRRVGSAPD